MFWNATFAHAEVLNYPENLRYSKIVKSHCEDKRNGDGDGVYAGGENRSSYDDDENDDIKQQLSAFSSADWSRAMFDKSTDHGNDSKVAQFSCRVRISKKRQRKRTSKTVVKKTSRQQFSMVCALIDHRNDFQMLKALQ